MLDQLSVEKSTRDCPKRPLRNERYVTTTTVMTPEEAVDYGIIDEVIQTKTSHMPKPDMPNLEDVESFL